MTTTLDMSTRRACASILDRDDPDARCPNCSQIGMTLVYEALGIPVHSTIQVDSREEAVAFERGNLRLGFCKSCGFVGNTIFDPSVHAYSTQCEESQAFSPTFNAFAKSLAERWVERYDIRNKTIVEIGCGKGDFLMLICEAGNNRGIGIDPSSQPERIPQRFRDRVRFIQELYGPQHASIEADVILCRHTLEHICRTGEFLANIRRVIGDRKDVLVLFELPDATRVLKEGAFWDIYYEHCSYFTPGSLARLFRTNGFEVTELERDYGDQYLLIGARPVDVPTSPRLFLEDDLPRTTALVEQFRARGAESIDRWHNEITNRVKNGQEVVLWSALSKAVSFLTTLKLGVEFVEYVVDINPHRHGKFMPGTGQQVVSPKFLSEYKPDCVILMNGIYTKEVQADLDRLGVKADLLSV